MLVHTNIYTGGSGRIRTHGASPHFSFQDCCLKPDSATLPYSKAYQCHGDSVLCPIEAFRAPGRSRLICFRIPCVAAGYVRVDTLTKSLLFHKWNSMYPVRPFRSVYSAPGTSFPIYTSITLIARYHESISSNLLLSYHGSLKQKTLGVLSLGS